MKIGKKKLFASPCKIVHKNRGDVPKPSTGSTAPAFPWQEGRRQTELDEEAPDLEMSLCGRNGDGGRGRGRGQGDRAEEGYGLGRYGNIASNQRKPSATQMQLRWTTLAQYWCFSWFFPILVVGYRPWQFLGGGSLTDPWK